MTGPRHYNVLVPMRDGICLATDIYLPSSEGPHPAILGRTPYNKNSPNFGRLIDAWNGHGYALLIQDVRGRGDSEGEFLPYRQEPPDGYDTIEWIASQPWSDGKAVRMAARCAGSRRWRSRRICAR